MKFLYLLLMVVSIILSALLSPTLSICLAILFISIIYIPIICLAYSNHKSKKPEYSIYELRIRYAAIIQLVDTITQKVFNSIQNEDKQIIESLDLSVQTNQDYLISFDKYVKDVQIQTNTNSYIEAACFMFSLVENPRAYSPLLASEKMTESDFENYSIINFEIALRCSCVLIGVTDVDKLLYDEDVSNILYHAINLGNEEKKIQLILFYANLLQVFTKFLNI